MPVTDFWVEPVGTPFYRPSGTTDVVVGSDPLADESDATYAGTWDDWSQFPRTSGLQQPILDDTTELPPLDLINSFQIGVEARYRVALLEAPFTTTQLNAVVGWTGSSGFFAGPYLGYTYRSPVLSAADSSYRTGLLDTTVGETAPLSSGSWSSFYTRLVAGTVQVQLTSTSGPKVPNVTPWGTEGHIHLSKLRLLLRIDYEGPPPSVTGTSQAVRRRFT